MFDQHCLECPQLRKACCTISNVPGPALSGRNADLFKNMSQLQLTHWYIFLTEKYVVQRAVTSNLLENAIAVTSGRPWHSMLSCLGHCVPLSVSERLIKQQRQEAV